MNRKEILLRAAYDLLKRSTQDIHVREATSILVRFNHANFDGYSLMEDIASELGLDDDEQPINLWPEDESSPSNANTELSHETRNQH